MAVLQLPEWIYSGLDSIGGIFEPEWRKMLVIADSTVNFSSSVFEVISQKAQKHNVMADFLMVEDHTVLTDEIQEKLMEEIPEVLVAVGDGRTIDRVAAASALSGIPYYAVPQCAPTALWSEDEIEVILTRRMPFGYILDPDMIVGTNSVKIAYEGLGMLTLCAESCLKAGNRYIRALARKAFIQIATNLFSAYKGEISAREDLLEAMGWAHIAYTNSFSFSWESPCYRLCEFFKPFGVDSLSILAVSGVQLIKRIFTNDIDELDKIAGEMIAEDVTVINGDRLIEKIRRLRAKMSVPSCIKNINISEAVFLKMADETNEEDRILFTECFYGDFFTKNDDTVLMKC